MRKNAGLFTVVAVVLAFFGISNIPKSNPAGPAPNGTEPKASQHPKKVGGGGVAAQVLASCGGIRSRVLPLVAGNTLASSAAPAAAWTLPESCYAAPAPARVERKNDANLSFLIAMAANPISTHLPLSFDRTLEIIQQAAQDNHYQYESSWLPWGEAKEYSHLPDEQAAEDEQDNQEKQPGVLIFRNPYGKIPAKEGEGGLVVFVVSELPTGGINQEEFDNAVEWIQQLGGLGDKPEIKILGPNFSGSLISMYRSVHFEKPNTLPGNLTFTIFSGSVTSNANYNWFKAKVGDEKLGTFRTAMEGDSNQSERFCRYIASQGYPADRIAFLSEDETAYGGGDPAKATGCVEAATNLYYPRDIATLRSAYEEQSIFNSGKQGSNANTATTTLRGDLSEPANSKHDTVRSYGGQLTPLAQESVLLDITDVLTERKIQFVVVRSTNSLDQIFLGQFLRRTVPEIRIVMDGADLLFRRGQEGASLRGVMLLSTYPLLTWQQDWTSTAFPEASSWRKLIPTPENETGGSYRIFGESSAQGVYIAARELIPDQGLAKGFEAIPVADYAPPAWARSDCGADADQRPGTWLTVIGHRQFWPMAVLNPYTLGGCAAQANTDVSLLPGAAEFKNLKLDTRDGDGQPLRHLPIEFLIFVVLMLVGSVLHLLWCACGSISPVPSAFRLAYFAPVPRRQHALLISLGCTVVAATAVITASNSGLLRWALGNWNAIIGAFLLGALASAVLACWKNFRLPPMTDPRFSAAKAGKWRRISAAGGITVVIAVIAMELAWLHRLTSANLFPTFWRSVHVLSGVSPLLPQLFLLAGLYSWFWFGLRGLSLFGDDRAVLPTPNDLTTAEGKPTMPMFSCEEAGDPTENLAMPLGKSYCWFVALITPIVFAVCALLLSQAGWLNTLGERAFGTFIFFWIILHVSLILADTAQCWATWRKLLILLNHIDLLALRRTLNALQGMSWSSVWAMSGDVLAERYCLIARQLEALRHLQNQVAEWTPVDTNEKKTQQELGVRFDEFLKLETSDPANPAGKIKTDLGRFVEWYEGLLKNFPVETVEPLRVVQAELASIAGMVVRMILLPAWHNEKESLIVNRAPKPKKDDEGTRPPSIYDNMPGYILAAEEFFVLPYLGFIRNIMGRIRTIILGSLCLFVATTFAVSSYPFDPLPVLGAIFLAVFVITGTTVVLIYAGMHRDATLSYVTDTSPGELGGEFWKQVFTFGVGPLIGLLTTLFPSIMDFIVSWLQPSAQVIK
ncbi:MAG TPA: hypothetical protein VGD60_00560 [Candidatus Acidoferrales bacterium]